MADVARQELDRDGGIAGQQVRRDRLGFLDVVGDQRLDHRHAEGSQRRLGFGLGQRRAALGDHIGEELARRGHVDRDLRRRGRRLHQFALGSAVAGQVGQRAHGFRRRVVGGNARLAQDGTRRCGLVLAQPARQDRLEARRLLASMSRTVSATACAEPDGEASAVGQFMTSSASTLSSSKTPSMAAR